MSIPLSLSMIVDAGGGAMHIGILNPKYAFDYIKRDWKSILKEAGFDNFKESFYLKKYVRLLEAVKSGE